MTMELERPKVIWREEKFEGTLFDKHVGQLLPGIKARLRIDRRKALVQDLLQVATGLAAVIVLGNKLVETRSILERTGLSVMLVGMIVIGAEIFANRVKSRTRVTGLSVKDYYLTERARVERSMRMRWRIWRWSALSLMIGFLPFLAATGPSAKEFVSFCLLGAAMIAMSARVVEQRIRRDLVPLKDELTRKLEKLEADGNGE